MLCIKCKHGVGMRIGFMLTQEDGSRKYSTFCPHCSAEYQEEPNINLNRRLYKILEFLSKLFWTILDKAKLVRSSSTGRYDTFGDESRYVKYWSYSEDWEPRPPVLKSRKWWEYILIEKRRFNL